MRVANTESLQAYHHLRTIQYKLLETIYPNTIINYGSILHEIDKYEL